ncbi:MAG: MFS transporter [Gemmatimonadetes bacterium]|nr:MFS transporter [Gemmatimonadota bacterium]
MKLDRRTILRHYGITAGTLGSTGGQTVMVAVLPILLARYAPSAVWIGFAVGGEGIFALLVPYWVGYLSDHLPLSLARRFGRRTFFLMLSAPIMALSIAAAPFLHGYWTLAAAAFVFFSALHGYLAPLWALLVDAVPDERRGRVQGVRGVLHSLGLGYGLVASGLLFGIWHPLPFLLAAALILFTTWLTILFAPKDAGAHAMQQGERSAFGAVIRDMRERTEIPWFLFANALWTGAVDGIRPYFFLFATVVIGLSVAQSSLVLVLLVVGLAVGSYVVGLLGDRFDRRRLLQLGGAITGVAMLGGFFVRTLPGAIGLLLVAGVGAAALVALPYPLFTSLIGETAIGRYTGLYILSVGLGRIVSPMLVGAAIDLGAQWLPALKGYPFMWPMAGLLTTVGAIALHQAQPSRRGQDAAPAEA